jgi:hypothetical protein
MPDATFTCGTTPEPIIRAALARELGGRDYPMELVGEDAEALRRVVNEGIDGRLTAVVGSRFHWRGHRLVCGVARDDLLVVLRRLSDDGGDDAWSLRGGILATLGSRRSEQQGAGAGSGDADVGSGSPKVVRPASRMGWVPATVPRGCRRPPPAARRLRPAGAGRRSATVQPAGRR